MIILRTTIARASAEAVSLPQGLAVTTRHAALHGREDSSEPTGILLPVSFKFIRHAEKGQAISAQSFQVRRRHLECRSKYGKEGLE